MLPVFLQGFCHRFLDLVRHLFYQIRLHRKAEQTIAQCGCLANGSQCLSHIVPLCAALSDDCDLIFVHHQRPECGVAIQELLRLLACSLRNNMRLLIERYLN